MIVLRDFQVRGIEAVAEAVGRSVQRMILSAPTGAGKGTLAAWLLAEARAQQKRGMFVVHRREIIKDLRRRLLDPVKGAGLREEDVGVILGNDPGRNPLAPIQVTSIDSLRGQVKPQADLVVIDECFPAGTLVDGRRIETICVGDEVWSYDPLRAVRERRVVQRVMRRPAPAELLRVRLFDGRAVVCTPEHPFYVGGRYVPASRLQRGYRLGIWHEPGDSLTVVRVKDVESVLTTEATCPGGLVYNLEVQEHHNYFAGDVLVHNCHRAYSKSYLDLLTEYEDATVLGLSVGPQSICELRGGPFGNGWVGTIEDAFDLIVVHAYARSRFGYTILQLENLGIESRGWTGSGFGWKTVKSMIRHECDRPARRLKVAGDDLVITDDHSVFRVEDPLGRTGKWRVAEFIERPSSAVDVGDVLPSDDGMLWERGTNEAALDVINSIDHSLMYVRVDLSTATRKELRVPSKNWYDFKNQNPLGPYLPVALFRSAKHLLPSPTRVYCRSSWVSPRVMLSRWAYMLGFWLGDGWVTSGRVCFAVQAAIVEAFINRLSILPDVGWTASVRTFKKQKGSVEVRYGNVLVAEIINSLFGGAKCHEKWIPGEWIVSWSREARMELLRGLLDSDGHISKRDRNRVRAYYSTTSLRLAKTLLSLLRSLGIAGSIHAFPPRIGGTIGGRVIHGRRSRYSIHWSASSMDADNSGHRGARRRFRHNGISFNESVVRKVDANIDRPSYVYDLEMDGHPSFVANGVLVHNTATPVRTDGKGLGDIFQELIVLAQPSELITAGHILEAAIYSPDPSELPDLTDVQTRAGEFRGDQLAQATKASRTRIGGVVRHWLELAEGRQTIVFAVDREDGRAIAEQFVLAGIDARVVHGALPTGERDELMRAYTSQEFPVLVNCEVLLEGFDDPATKCVVCMRPTLSITIHLQSIGRCLRPWGGVSALVLDHAGNTLRLGLPHDDRIWTLDKTQPKRGGMAPCKVCPKKLGGCGQVVPASARVCPKCEHKFPEPEGLQTIEGRLIEFKPLTPEEAERRFWNTKAMHAHHHGLARWWVAKEFRVRFGHDAPAEFQMPDLPPPVFTAAQKAQEWKRLMAVQRASQKGATWAIQRYRERFREDPVRRTVDPNAEAKTAPSTLFATAPAPAVPSFTGSLDPKVRS